MTDQTVNRRAFLRGVGTAIALPAALESVLSTRAMATTARSEHPLRMAVFFVPNGAHMPDWTPAQEGPHYELPRILQPLASFKRDITVLSGLTHDKGRANGDGAGDHARSAGVFLTGTQPLKSEGAEIRAGVSFDQIAAMAKGYETRFPSLELGAEPGRQSGKCDSGYSCAYSNNISWRDASTPMTKETNPRLVFERLFSNELRNETAVSQGLRNRYRKSILDFVLEDARRLTRKVSGQDRYKLDEYLTSIREIERRIENAEGEDRSVARLIAGADIPQGTPSSYEEHLKLMGDLLVLAFQSDVTRISTFMLANEGSNRPYKQIGISEGHHTLSHHQNDPVKLDKISRINQFHVDQFAYILHRLRSIKEGDGTLLDNCMLLYGSGISDGNRHNNENLPILIAGKGGGSIQSGRHIRYPEETPMSNLLLAMLHRFGVPTDHFGDSTGVLKGLS